MIAALNRHLVDYVVIGGYGAIIHGAPIPATKDLDITPSSDAENLRRLAAALTELGAKLRGRGLPAEGLSFPLDEVMLGRMSIVNLTTLAGELDISFVPSGTAGYPDLTAKAVSLTLSGQRTRVASLEDIIRSKTAAGRPKDLATLDILVKHAAGAAQRNAPLSEQASPHRIGDRLAAGGQPPPPPKITPPPEARPGQEPPHRTR